MQNYHLNSSKQSMTQSILEEDIARTEIEKAMQKFESILSPHLSEKYRNDLRRMMLIRIHQFHADILRQMVVIQRDELQNSSFDSVCRIASIFKTASRSKLEAMSL